MTRCLTGNQCKPAKIGDICDLREPPVAILASWSALHWSAGILEYFEGFIYKSFAMADSYSVDKKVEGESYDIWEVPGDEGACGGQHVGLSDEDDYLDDDLYGTALKQKVEEPSFETIIDDVDELIDNTANQTMN